MKNALEKFFMSSLMLFGIGREKIEIKISHTPFSVGEKVKGTIEITCGLTRKELTNGVLSLGLTYYRDEEYSEIHFMDYNILEINLFEKAMPNKELGEKIEFEFDLPNGCPITVGDWNVRLEAELKSKPYRVVGVLPIEVRDNVLDELFKVLSIDGYNYSEDFGRVDSIDKIDGNEFPYTQRFKLKKEQRLEFLVINKKEKLIIKNKNNGQINTFEKNEDKVVEKIIEFIKQ